MKTRCKPGEVAVILFDEPSCIDNVGRLVRIHPDLRPNSLLELDCWIIEPIDKLPWAISQNDGSVFHTIIDLGDRIEHPDKWMLPIRDEFLIDEEMAAYGRIQESIDQDLIRIGAVRPEARC